MLATIVTLFYIMITFKWLNFYVNVTSIEKNDSKKKKKDARLMLYNFCLFHSCQPLTPAYRDLRAKTHRLLGNLPHAKAQMPISLAFSLCAKHLDLGKFYLALPGGIRYSCIQGLS